MPYDSNTCLRCIVATRMTLEEAVKSIKVTGVNALIGKLNKHNIKGIQVDCRECPIAKLLSHLVGQPVLVNGVEARLVDTNIVVPLPANVRYFISNFDHGSFQDLNIHHTEPESV